MPQRSDHQASHTRAPRRTIYTATPQDLPFLDELQKKFTNDVGFMPAPALTAYVRSLSVLITTEDQSRVGYLLGRQSLHWQPLLRPIYQICIEPTHHGNNHARDLVTAWEHLARISNQVGMQANCAAQIGAHSFWPAMGFRFICIIPTHNARHRDIVCWRKPLIKNVPRWFINQPHRAGYRGRKTREGAS